MKADIMQRSAMATRERMRPGASADESARHCGSQFCASGLHVWQQQREQHRMCCSRRLHHPCGVSQSDQMGLRLDSGEGGGGAHCAGHEDADGRLHDQWPRRQPQVQNVLQVARQRHMTVGERENTTPSKTVRWSSAKSRSCAAGLPRNFKADYAVVPDDATTQPQDAAWNCARLWNNLQSQAMTRTAAPMACAINERLQARALPASSSHTSWNERVAAVRRTEESRATFSPSPITSNSSARHTRKKSAMSTCRGPARSSLPFHRSVCPWRCVH